MIVCTYAHDSDVHVADDEGGTGLFCRQCRLSGGAHWPTHDPMTMYDHLLLHREAADQVQDAAFVDLAERAGIVSTAVDHARVEPPMDPSQVSSAALWMRNESWWSELVARVRWWLSRVFGRTAEAKGR